MGQIGPRCYRLGCGAKKRGPGQPSDPHTYTFDFLCIEGPRCGNACLWTWLPREGEPHLGPPRDMGQIGPRCYRLARGATHATPGRCVFGQEDAPVSVPAPWGGRGALGLVGGKVWWGWSGQQPPPPSPPPPPRTTSYHARTPPPPFRARPMSSKKTLRYVCRHRGVAAVPFIWPGEGYGGGRPAQSTCCKPPLLSQSFTPTSFWWPSRHGWAPPLAHTTLSTSLCSMWRYWKVGCLLGRVHIECQSSPWANNGTQALERSSATQTKKTMYGITSMGQPLGGFEPPT